MTNLHILEGGLIAPDLARRACGGWLATAPKDSGFSIGVTAETADKAREEFGIAMRRWLEILATGAKPHGQS
jgi:hypothetical protein